MPVDYKSHGLPHWRDDPEADGFTVIDCECGKKMWLGPRQRQAQMTHNALALCVFCCGMLKGGFENIEVKSLEDQAKEN
jgi:hypothetical protein